jgi:hypothetical protein
MKKPIHLSQEERLAALRQAVQLGIDSANAGRVRTFDSSEELGRHLNEVAERVLTETKAKRKG